MKNILILTIAFVLCIATVRIGFTNSAKADDPGAGPSGTTDTTGSGDITKTPSTCSTTSFLAFPTWYRGLSCASDGTIDSSQIKGYSPSVIIFTVALNVLDILLRVVGILAVAYVVYGGFIFATARGEPDRAAKGRSAILQAVIGMVIAIVASAADSPANH